MLLSSFHIWIQDARGQFGLGDHFPRALESSIHSGVCRHSLSLTWPVQCFLAISPRSLREWLGGRMACLSKTKLAQKGFHDAIVSSLGFDFWGEMESPQKSSERVE